MGQSKRLIYRGNIRKEKDSDKEKIWKVNAEAFETEAEANLVNALRDSGISFLSLVAEEDEEIVCHILFTPVELIGFVPSVKYGIKSEYDAPDEAFMVLELKESSLKDKNGIIKYHAAFGSV